MRLYAPRRPAKGPREGVGRNWGRGAAEALHGILRSGGGTGAETGRCHDGIRSSSGFLDGVDAAAGHGGAGRAGNRRCGRYMARWAGTGVMASARCSYARARCIAD